MSKAIFGILFAVLVFALSATGSWYLIQNQSDESQTSEDAATDTASTRLTSSSDQSKASDQGKTLEMPVVVRSRPMSPEEVFRYGVTLRNREGALKKQQNQLKTEQLQLKLIQDDIRGDQRELEGMLTQIRDEIATAEKLLASIQQERRRMQEELKGQTEYKQQELENIKRMSQWVEGMTPETAAEFLRELSDDGKMETAIQLLGYFEERKASKILEAMNDPALIRQLIEKFKGLKRPKKKTRKR